MTDSPPRVHEALDAPGGWDWAPAPWPNRATVTVAFGDGRSYTFTSDQAEMIQWTEVEDITQPGDTWKRYRPKAVHVRVQMNAIDLPPLRTSQ